ncbi:MAG: T9SS type A sorting domain-containing protein [Saprospiraceae bacterium]|nr:T9SS type A sorting domain-containing protein [Saprospiraceae bacterium]
MKHTTSPFLSLLMLALSMPAIGHNSIHFPSESTKNIVTLTAESTGWSAELFWTCSFDKNLVSFVVQRSFDGEDYHDIISYDNHFVAAGDTDAFREQDSDPMPGDNFYRVMFVLSDGEKVFSERKKLYFKEVAAFEIFPNPTGRQVNLLMKKFRGKEVEVNVFDGIGNRVYNQFIPCVDDGMLRIELNAMNPGMFAVSVTHKGKTFTRRVVVASNLEN